MGGLGLGLLIGYIIGGLTFLPLLVWTLWTLGTRDANHYPEEAMPGSPDKEVGVEHNDWEAGLGEDLLRKLKAKHAPDAASGYFAVSREYVPGGVNGKPPERTTPATGAVTAMESPSVYQSMYRSIFDRSKTTSPTFSPAQGKSKKTRNVFYIVLRLGHLMLYDDSEQVEVRHVISLAHYSVSIYAGGERIPEGELWIKRNCIRLASRDPASTVGDSRSYYLFSDNCSEKEDFYHAMLRSQESHVESSPGPPPPLKFNPADLIKLVQQLHASEENFNTRWINALIGRLFLAMYKTKHIENFIWTKITKKIDRVQKPSLISSVKVQKLDMGDMPPFITNPKLKELTVDGDLTVEADISYKGNFRIDISAVARIELGSRFKPREVTIILATILKSLEGRILIRVKPPPSNRLWVTFEVPPKMELSVEPIVSSRQITYGVILRAIESRIREVVNETLVLPNWDDMPFFATESRQFRGGIWKDEIALGIGSHVVPVEPAQALPDELPSGTASTSSAVYSSASDAGKSVSSLGLNNLHKRNTTQLETTEDSSEISPLADRSPRIKPRPMRASSYTHAGAATPTVDTDPAFSQSIERGEEVNAAALMKDTAARSPPLSPSNPPLPPRIRTSTERRHSSSPDRGKEVKPTHSFDDILATMPAQETSIGIRRNTSPEKGTEQPSEAASAQKRLTLNQSLNTATNAAKKWLAARQTTNANDPANTSPKGSEGKELNEATHSRSSSKNGLQIPQGPIGRGQPLPPPGTPLPHPAKDRRGTWSAQTASALVNLAKRVPVGAKTPTVPSAPASPHVSETPMEAETDHLGPDRPHVNKSASDEAVPITPPPLPKRRQRKSIAETPSIPKREEMFVVEAPMQDLSVPTSPAAAADEFLFPQTRPEKTLTGLSRKNE
ncbi:uncharacterized protein N0V89_003107 [Didymosphaeria variabile]|uniref:SMP-LTD domain-containing protein n=1 Tax=Didymosphaeria variabile TaxID=1932322 RepID=A0A9W9CF82_9PLEO|nr:uncharacterized protein N0V89_003107 [Didymosphaeria variabile]KAJ4358523.1 hypothetical protein N0V89_003107 [Didymosphaeria variabile]